MSFPCPIPTASESFQAHFTWQGGTIIDGHTTYTADVPVDVLGIIGRIDSPTGGAATLQVMKAGSGTAFSAGVAVTTGTLNLNGTANTNQVLTLSAVAGATHLNTGDSLGFISSGALGTGTGCITITMAPG